MMPGLGQRIWFTIGALLVYRLGTQIPLPGIDLRAWDAIFQREASGLLGMSNVLSGGAVRHLAVLSLGVSPYVPAAILLHYTNIPLYFSGISLLVAVCVTLDIKAQFQAAAPMNFGGEFA